MSSPHPLPCAMQKSDTWPGGVAMESLSNMDSAGSCDSVISVNSGYSEDSMEHLSAEERACLMYLEETIEALEVQEDSGLSNDEPDPVLLAEKMGGMQANDISSFKSESGEDRKSDNQTSEPQTSLNELCITKDEDGNLKIVSSAELLSGESAKAPEIDLGLILPPSDFRDEPGPPLGHPPQLLSAKDLLSSSGRSNNKSGGTVDLDELSQKALKRNSVSSPVTQEPPNESRELSPLVVSPGPQLSPAPEAVAPRSPPAVAPKPKKLPANIILKSHKSAVADGHSGHSVHTNSDRLLLDPQRVRMEALRKLGLLKSDDSDTGPALSPKLSPKTGRSWAAPPSPISPAASRTPPLTPSYTRLNSPSPATTPLQSPAAAASPLGPSTPPAVLLPHIVPAPAAFSDPGGPLLSDNELSAVRDRPEVIGNLQANTPPGTPPVLVKQLTPARVKSATLERSGLGLSSYMAGQDFSAANQGVRDRQTPSQLRNSRPRPSSLGSGKEFSSAQGERSHMGGASSKEPDLRRSLPAFQHSGDSQKLPRSEGISVLICPRAENGDARREALKRLGLLRD